MTWNVSNVGAIADEAARAYGVSLAAVGLLTTALFVTHLAVQLPAGRACDRFGARRVAFAALAAVCAGNLLLLLDAGIALGLAGRAVVGIGSGAGFVAGADYARAANPSPVVAGLYGGATLVGGGLATATVPQLVGALHWRAPYVTALVAAIATAGALALAPRLAVAARPRKRFVFDPRLVRLGILSAGTFGASVVAANWIVPLLEHHGTSRGPAAAIGALLLLGGLVTRPLGGLVLRARFGAANTLIAAGTAGLAVSLGLLALPLPLPLAALAALLGGLAAGFPFAALFATAQRTVPDAPGAAVGFVNAWAILTILVGTPLVGATFSLPAGGRLGFGFLSAFSALTLLGIARVGATRED